MGGNVSKRWNFHELAKVISHFGRGAVACGVPGTTAGGLWSQVLLAMNRPDTKKLRKNLQALWKQNCGNIKVLVEKFVSGVSEPDYTILLASTASDGAADEPAQSSVSGRAVGRPRWQKVASTTTSQGAVIATASTANDDVADELAQSSVSSETVDNPRRRNPSSRKRRQFSDQWSVLSLSKVYCVCRKSWKGEAMIQCDSCDVWYHCSCLQIDPIVCNKYAGKDVQFVCGRSGCNSGNMLLKLPDNVKSLSDNVVPSSPCVDVPADVTVSTCTRVPADDLMNSVPMTETASALFDDVDNNNVSTLVDNECTCVKTGVDVPDESCDNDVSALVDHQYSSVNTAFDMNSMVPDETCANILGCSVPDSDVFEKELPQSAQFTIAAGVLSSLRVGQSRYLAKGRWQSVFVNGMKESNSWCVMCFKYHTVCTESKLRRSPTVFKASGYCCVSECNVAFEIKMLDEVNVTVYYSGKVRHPLCEQYARPIRGHEREALKRQFSCGSKPYSVYMERLNTKKGDELLAGNFDAIGKSKGVLRKISSEAMHHLRLDENVYKSLLIMQSEIHKDHVSVNNIRSFVQYVGIAPIVVHYWTENGVRLFHHLSCCHALFLDATGSVVRKLTNCKRILYYEVSLRNPNGVGCSIPIAAMLSSEHTVTVIANFLQSFRDAEKRIFGFRNIVTPLCIKVDFSMALISSILMAFNRQNLEEYLKFCWDVITGVQSGVGRVTVHVCLGHFIKCVKGHCVKIFKAASELVLYAISLMVCADTLEDIRELFSDLCIILCSPHQNPIFVLAFARLQHKITNYDTKSLKSVVNTEESCDDCCDSTNVHGTEDHVLTCSPTSPFLQWASLMYASALLDIQSHDNGNTDNINRFCNVTLFEKIQKLYMPTLPLWNLGLACKFLIAAAKGCKHVQCRVSDVTITIPRTSGTQEQRFTVLKKLVLQGRRTLRMDEFSEKLKHMFVATEKDYVVNYLRVRKKRISRSSTVPVEESWAKKQKQTVGLANPKIGKYQQAAPKGISDLNYKRVSAMTRSGKKLIMNKPFVERNKHVHTEGENSKNSVVLVGAKFSPMANFGSTCWFNAAMQALHKTDVCATIVERFEHFVDVDSNPAERNKPLHDCLCEILRFMTHEAPNPVPHPMILRCISLYNRLFDQRRIGTRTQHDVHEFLTDCIFSLFTVHSVCLQFLQEIRCITCGEPSSTQREETCPCLVLAVPDSSVHGINVQQLVDEYFAGQGVSAVCCSAVCNGTVKNKVVRNRFTCLPESVIILLQRYRQCNKTIVKKNVNVLVNRYVKLHCTDVNTTVGVKDYTFSLCSVVSHSGSSPNHGHYTASVLQELECGGLSFAVCDDSNINVVSTSCMDGNIIQPDHRTVSDAVLLMYNRHFSADKRLLPLLVGLQRTTGLVSVVHALRSTAFVAAKQRFRIASDILSGKHVDTLLSDISSIARVNVTDFSSCKLLVYTLISDLARTLDIRCNTFFLHSSNVAQGRECSSGQTVLFLESNNVIHAHSQSTEAQAQLHFFPDTILVVCSDSEPLQEILNLSCRIHHVFPSQTLLYEFVGAISWQNSSIVFYDSLSSADASASILLYNMKKELYCTMFIAQNKNDINKQLGCVNLASDNFNLADVDHIARSYCGVVLTNTHWHLIMSRQWFTDVIVDSYFTLLARHVSETVLVYSCSFFSTLFFHQNPDKPKVSLCRKEHCRTSWFNAVGAPLFDFVVIPGSLLNAHFVTVVIDLRTQCILMCDPMQCSQNKIVYQVARYMCQEYFLSTGTALDVKKLSLLNYCNWDTEFPRQRDTHNCGAYICLIVKCIVQNKLLRFQSPELLRKTVCHELIHNNLL